MLLLGLFILIGRTNAAEEILPRDADFQRGVELAQQGRDAEALPHFKKALKTYPEDPSLLWNLGISSTGLGQDREALEYWKKYQHIQPDDWRVRAKLIQAYQALGELGMRDREHEALYELWHTSSSQEIRAVELFCREQFDIKGHKVFVLEYFDPQGKMQKYYRFSITDQNGDEEFSISLESYQTTNEISWESGELARDQRLYHLDRYDPGMHTTLGFYKGKPSYDTVRARVLSELTGKLEPLSATNSSQESFEGD